MKERPIPFSAPMVHAILAGTKTQTRRMVKPVGDDDGFVLQDYGRGWWPYRSDDGESPMKGDNEIPHACPYGQPGERLWVREAWAAPHAFDHLPPRLIEPGTRITYASDPDGIGGLRGRPGMFMPRWASRIALEVTGVRVERLQDISEADAVAEGLEQVQPGRWRIYGPHTDGADMDVSPRVSYRSLWESINGDGSWDENPWVWVVEFRRIAA